jgi:ribosomal protein L33
MEIKKYEPNRPCNKEPSQITQRKLPYQTSDQYAHIPILQISKFCKQTAKHIIAVTLFIQC